MIESEGERGRVERWTVLMEPLDKNSDVRIPSGRHCYGAYPLKLSCLTQEGGGLRDCGREAGSGVRPGLGTEQASLSKSSLSQRTGKRGRREEGGEQGRSSVTRHSFLSTGRGKLLPS